jgi:hypothetical protein
LVLQLGAIDTLYQLAFVTPGISPRCASSLKQILHKPNLRKYPCGLPQRLQRLYPRVLYFGLRDCLAIIDFLATNDLHLQELYPLIYQTLLEPFKLENHFLSFISC